MLEILGCASFGQVGHWGTAPKRSQRLTVVSAAFSSVTKSRTSDQVRSRRALRSISTCSRRCTVPYGFAPWATHSFSVLMSSEWQLVIVDGVSSASNWRQVGGACLQRLGFVGG